MTLPNPHVSPPPPAPSSPPSPPDRACAWRHALGVSGWVALALIACGCATTAQPVASNLSAPNLPNMRRAEAQTTHFNQTQGTRFKRMRIERLYRSEIIEGDEMVELVLVDDLTETWRASCLSESREGIDGYACTLLGRGVSGAKERVVLAARGPRWTHPRGITVGARAFDVQGNMPSPDHGIYSGDDLHMRRARDGKLMGVMQYRVVGEPVLWTAADAAPSTERWLEAIALTLIATRRLVVDPEDAGPLNATRNDSLPVRWINHRSASMAPRFDYTEALETLEDRDAGDCATLLRRKDEIDHRRTIDIRSKPYKLRHDVHEDSTGFAFEASVGAADGTIAAADTGDAVWAATLPRVGLGLRFGQRAQVLLTGAYHLSAPGEDVPLNQPLPRDLMRDYTPGITGFDFGIMGRVATPLGAGVELTLALGVEMRNMVVALDRAAEFNTDPLAPNAVDQEAFAYQADLLGVGISPTLGLQYGVPFNTLGDRGVFFVEVGPRWTMWTVVSPSPEDTDEEAALVDQRVREAFTQDTDAGGQVFAGFRLEL